MAESIHLRPAREEDIPLFFDHHLEWRSSVGGDGCPRDVQWSHFFARWQGILADETKLVMTILSGAQTVGYVARLIQEEQPAIAYVLSRAVWGRGIATRAVSLFLGLVAAGPLHARIACDNQASLRVLQKNGFQLIGTSRFFSEHRGEEIDELVLRLS